MAVICAVKNHKVTTGDLQELYEHCHKALPMYAIPRFIRTQPEMEITTTFKQRKVELVKEGFDPAKAKGSELYCIDFSKKTYLPLTSEMYKNISKGQIRL